MTNCLRFIAQPIFKILRKAIVLTETVPITVIAAIFNAIIASFQARQTA